MAKEPKADSIETGFVNATITLLMGLSGAMQSERGMLLSLAFMVLALVIEVIAFVFDAVIRPRFGWGPWYWRR